jgi:hypothetical protein
MHWWRSLDPHRRLSWRLLWKVRLHGQKLLR